MVEMRDLLPFWQEVRRSQEASRTPGGLNLASGLTEVSGVVLGARSRIRALLQERVAKEADKFEWPSRAARRDWVRREVAKRYHELVVPDPTKS